MPNHITNERILAILRQVTTINLSPVRNVRPWYPTSSNEITFRVATDEEVIYISFPDTISVSQEGDLR